MWAMTKRNLKLYFSNKASVFFSLLGALIAFILYVVFLQKNMQDSFTGTPNLEELLDNWVLGGTLAVTSITTTWTGISRLVQDKVSHKLEDFLLTDISRLKLYLGYLISSSVIGFIMQLVMLVTMKLYFYWQDGIDFGFTHLPQLLLIMLLSSIMGAGFALLVLQFVKTLTTNEALSTIVGTVSGFLVGVYMPIGALPDFAQKVVKLTPAAYVSAAYRQLLIAKDAVNTDAKEILGIGLKLKNLTTLNQEMLLVSLVICGIIVLLALSLYLERFSLTKNK
ncbi:ABC transporter permease [Streptococcus equinus]|uniref:ABC transporter permease n=1 Tax=Streptococcus equinus TaxID=1335 RepID=UPI0008873A4C|nr:ABC transporter permease [Streptococcus equinus]SDQ37179.1 multidrug/hemolysin transport system permease protein [Streptococcus equinus]SFC24139.1 multidrug/hemolysin transport system permease protein [Streptococcus equinus]